MVMCIYIYIYIYDVHIYNRYLICVWVYYGLYNRYVDIGFVYI